MTRAGGARTGTPRCVHHAKWVPASITALEGVRALAHGSDDARSDAGAIIGLAVAAYTSTDFERGIALVEEGLAVSERIGAIVPMVAGLGTYASIAFVQGRFREALDAPNARLHSTSRRNTIAIWSSGWSLSSLASPSKPCPLRRGHSPRRDAWLAVLGRAGTGGWPCSTSCVTRDWQKRPARRYCDEQGFRRLRRGNHVPRVRAPRPRSAAGVGYLHPGSSPRAKSRVSRGSC